VKLKAGTLVATGRAASWAGAWTHAAVTSASATTAIRLIAFTLVVTPGPVKDSTVVLCSRRFSE